MQIFEYRTTNKVQQSIILFNILWKMYLNVFKKCLKLKNRRLSHDSYIYPTTRYNSQQKITTKIFHILIRNNKEVAAFKYLFGNIFMTFWEKGLFKKRTKNITHVWNLFLPLDIMVNKKNSRCKLLNIFQLKSYWKEMQSN